MTKTCSRRIKAPNTVSLQNCLKKKNRTKYSIAPNLSQEEKKEPSTISLQTTLTIVTCDMFIDGSYNPYYEMEY
jgi:hypothetical protein